MKHILYILALITALMGLSTATAWSQQAEQNIERALRQGNASLLSDNMNNNVQLRINGSNVIVVKSQCEQIMEKFFRENRPSQFTYSNKGNRSESQTLQGTLQTSGGTYKVYILLKNTNSTYLIHQLRIENGTD